MGFRAEPAAKAHGVRPVRLPRELIAVCVINLQRQERGAFSSLPEPALLFARRASIWRQSR
jgi:hypothetical protein